MYGLRTTTRFIRHMYGLNTTARFIRHMYGLNATTRFIRHMYGLNTTTRFIRHMYGLNATARFLRHVHGLSSTTTKDNRQYRRHDGCSVKDVLNIILRGWRGRETGRERGTRAVERLWVCECGYACVRVCGCRGGQGRE